LWEVKANELKLDPESWVEKVEQCKMITLHILHSREDENEEYIAECR